VISFLFAKTVSFYVHWKRFKCLWVGL